MWCRFYSSFILYYYHLASGSDGIAAREWERRLRDAERESVAQKALFDRELFFAIQPRGRLVGMIGRYKELFD